MSARVRIPRTVGIKPTAMYGSTISVLPPSRDAHCIRSTHVSFRRNRMPPPCLDPVRGGPASVNADNVD